MKQETRNKIYAVAASIGVIAIITGKVTQEQVDAGTVALGEALDLVGQVITLATTGLAFFKSLPSRVTTVEVPKDQVGTINLHDGSLVNTKGKHIA